MEMRRCDVQSIVDFREENCAWQKILWKKKQEIV